MGTDLNTTWGHRLKSVRAQRGMSALELSRRAEITSQYVYMLEAGRYSPSDEVRVRIAAALEVQVEDIWSYPQDVAS